LTYFPSRIDEIEENTRFIGANPFKKESKVTSGRAGRPVTAVSKVLMVSL